MVLVVAHRGARRGAPGGATTRAEREASARALGQQAVHSGAVDSRRHAARHARAQDVDRERHAARRSEAGHAHLARPRDDRSRSSSAWSCCGRRPPRRSSRRDGCMDAVAGPPSCRRCSPRSARCSRSPASATDRRELVEQLDPARLRRSPWSRRTRSAWRSSPIDHGQRLRRLSGDDRRHRAAAHRAPIRRQPVIMARDRHARRASAAR